MTDEERRALKVYIQNKKFFDRTGMTDYQTEFLRRFREKNKITCCL